MKMHPDWRQGVSRAPLKSESAGKPDPLQTLRDQARRWTNSRQRLECVRFAGAFGIHTARSATLTVMSSGRGLIWRTLFLLRGKSGWLAAFLLFVNAAVFAAEPPANSSLEGAWKWTF